MTKPMVRIYTDAENFIDREMNAEEYAQWEKDKAATEAELAQIAAKAEAREAVLAKLGLSADEVAALLG
jgi:hypothetical protein